MPLCGICDALDVQDNNVRPKDSRLGEYSELMSRADAGCDACRFFCDVLQNSNSWSHRLDKLPGNIVFLHSKRLDVRKPDEVNGTSYSCDDLLFDHVVSEDYTGPRDDDTDIRRIIPVNPEDDACFEQLRSWLDECSEHEHCPKSRESPLPATIIEIFADPQVSPKLISSEGRMGRYVVLSHATSDKDTTELAFPGVGQSLAMDILPKTFADAITTTRRLGYQYLWIPEYCRFRDDTTDSEVSDLANIYGNAMLMISATTSESLSSGILSPRKVLCSPALGKNKDHFMRQNLLRWDEDLKYTSPTTPHGWRILERILAPRIVHYTKRQMIFECAEGLKYEAAGIPDKVTGRGQIRMNYRKGFVQPFITEYLNRQNTPNDIKNEQEVSSEKDISTRLEAWHQTIDELSKHTYTHVTALLQANSIIAQILNPNQELGPYLSGIWTSHLSSGFSWGRRYPVLTRPSTYRAPSWSPLSIDGEISSMFLDWKEAMFADQRTGPGKEFVEKYAPKLVETDIRLVDENNAYGVVKEGSNITISGQVTLLMKLLTTVNEDEDDTFHPTFVLDRDSVLDCPVCANHGEHPSEVESEEHQMKIKEQLESYLVMFVQGAFWGKDLGEGLMDAIVLSKMEEGEGYERVGFLRLGLDYSQHPVYEKEDGSFNREVVYEKFEGLGWEGKELVLF